MKREDGVSDNPMLRRLAKATQTGHGTLSERRVAKGMGARLQPASGAVVGFKGDMKKAVGDYKFLIESKSTIHATLPLDIGWLAKISSEALARASRPAVTVSFVRQDGKPQSKTNAEWVLIDMVTFNEMLTDLEVRKNE